MPPTADTAMAPDGENALKKDMSFSEQKWMEKTIDIF